MAQRHGSFWTDKRLKISLAKARDSERISQLIYQLSAKYIANEFADDASRTLLVSMKPDVIEENMEMGFRYHIATSGERLIGVVAVRDNTHLFHLFVAEQFQRQGIASELWGVAMNRCLDEGNVGEFTVNSSRYALGFYKKLGFVASSGPQEKNGITFYPMELILT